MTNINDHNITEKVKQSIYYGSVYEALTGDFITTDDVLNYLLHAKCDHKTMVAYKAVCTFSMDQVINNNEYTNIPFVLLTGTEEYVAIYTLQFCRNGMVPGRNDLERKEIARRTQRMWPKLLIPSKFSRSMHIICDSDVDITSDEKSIIIEARCANLMLKLQRHLLNNFSMFLNYDYLAPLSNVKYSLYENSLIDRCNMLKKEAPLYWEYISSNYEELIEENIDIENPKMSREMLRKYCDLFPDLFDKNLMNMSDLEYNLNQLPETVQAYVLGFPIHQYVPSAIMINKAIRKLNEIGIDSYCKLIERQNYDLFAGKTNIYFQPDFIVGNKQDALTENVCEFSSFDIICDYNDTHVYFFTRAEFHGLIKSRKNYWTNKILPLSLLSVCTSRIETSIMCNLPPSAPLNQLLKKVEAGTLYNTNVPNAPNNSNPKSVPVPNNSVHNSVNSPVGPSQSVSNRFDESNRQNESPNDYRPIHGHEHTHDHIRPIHGNRALNALAETISERLSQHMNGEGQIINVFVSNNGDNFPEDDIDGEFVCQCPHHNHLDSDYSDDIMDDVD